MARRRGLSTCGAMAIGFFLAPIVGLVTLFGLVLAAEAMGIDTLSQFERAADGMLSSAGLASTPTATPTDEPAPRTFEYGPLATIVQPTPFQPEPVTRTPLPTAPPSLTLTASATITPSATPTEMPFPTSSVTPTPSNTPTSPPATVLWPTFTASRTRTPTRTPTRTLTRTTTATPSPSPTGSPGIPPTLAAPTDTSESPATSESSTPTSGAPPTAAPPTATTPPPSACDAAANATVEGQVIALINEERADEGLKAYSVDSRLTAAARVHAADMACNHFTSHTGSDGSSVRDRVEAQGYDWSWIGENYFVGSGSAQTAFNWWMNSAPHTANILSPNYTQFGVGYVYDADSDYKGYFVIVFAKPG